jgi:hypothetical protein
LGTVTNENSIPEEIKNRLNSGNACYSAFQNLSPCLLSENLEIRIYRTNIPVLCRSFTLRKERGLRVLQSRALRIFGPEGESNRRLEKG